MLTAHATKLQRSGLLLLVFLLSACTLGSVLVFQAGHQYRYSDARSRWNASGLTHYRLNVAVEQSCTISTEVRSEQVARIEQQDSCMHPARTVTDLFALIERGQISERCFFAGCACRIDVITYARYDPTYGYPLTITLRYDRTANWWTQGFWRYILDHGHFPGCAYTSESNVIQSIRVTPLQ
ncbi:MAG: DUF6174 domain-containing protein [Roseiflexaceae bacterium]|nr:DUF6174 domain-containing protein [Roseiflexaceae bacterium]